MRDAAFLLPLGACCGCSADFALYWLLISVLSKIRPVSPYSSTIDPPFLARGLGMVRFELTTLWICTRCWRVQACFHRPITPYLPCLHNHLSNPLVSSPFGTSPLAVFHLVEAPKFLWPAGFFIKFFTFRVSGLSSPSQITRDSCPL